ncbi:hypothetical protein GQ54DRAFT_142512 [Martensiomyces pterosporus]|nr:hypothetical protein GQ54DRAFT_142512 [Martensiomyces pterosporus]
MWSPSTRLVCSACTCSLFCVYQSARTRACRHSSYALEHQPRCWETSRCIHAQAAGYARLGRELMQIPVSSAYTKERTAGNCENVLAQ